MAYQILTTATLVDFLKQLKVMEPWFGDCAGLEVYPLSEGSINAVFRVVQPSSGVSVIVKQAVPFVRSAGEGYPLDRRRMDIEMAALQMAADVVPSMVPRVLYRSVELSVVILQDLFDCQMLNAAILAARPLPHFAAQLADFLAQTHFAYSRMSLSDEQRRSVMSDFVNEQMCQLMMAVMFESPFKHTEGNAVSEYLPIDVIASVRDDLQLLARVAMLKDNYLTKKQSLIHGDLHAGSIMVSDTQSYVIDPEFAFYGPIGFDIGCIFGNLYMFHFLHKHLAYESCRFEYANWLLRCIDDIWALYCKKFSALWQSYDRQVVSSDIELFLAQVRADADGFAGVKLIRRVLGRDNLGYFSKMSCQRRRAIVERDVLAFARLLMSLF